MFEEIKNKTYDYIKNISNTLILYRDKRIADSEMLWASLNDIAVQGRLTTLSDRKGK